MQSHWIRTLDGRLSNLEDYTAQYTNEPIYHHTLSQKSQEFSRRKGVCHGWIRCSAILYCFGQIKEYEKKIRAHTIASAHCTILYRITARAYAMLYGWFLGQIYKSVNKSRKFTVASAPAVTAGTNATVYVCFLGLIYEYRYGNKDKVFYYCIRINRLGFYAEMYGFIRYFRFFSKLIRFV